MSSVTVSKAVRAKATLFPMTLPPTRACNLPIDLSHQTYILTRLLFPPNLHIPKLIVKNRHLANVVNAAPPRRPSRAERVRRIRVLHRHPQPPAIRRKERKSGKILWRGRTPTAQDAHDADQRCSLRTSPNLFFLYTLFGFEGFWD